jgi:acylphosphatase
MIARRIVVAGRVQGVGFRQAMVAAAQASGVAGWVRNRGDGSVEAMVQGEAETVQALIAWCRRGPALARVDSVEVSDQAPEAAPTGFAQRASA